MYKIIDNKICITKKDLLMLGMTERQYKYDKQNSLLSVIKQSWHGNTLIDVKSIKRPERLEAIEAKFGKIDRFTQTKCIYKVELLNEARDFFLSQTNAKGEPLDVAFIEKYTAKASIMEAIKRGLEKQIKARAALGKKIGKKEFWADMLKWYEKVALEYKVPIYTNVRSLERAFQNYLNGGYKAVMNKNIGNEKSRKVSKSMENLFLALYRKAEKPFVSEVYEDYCAFVSGEKEIYDKSTGETFVPADFRYEGRALEVSNTTIWNYLKDIMNNTAVFADRNGNFDYNNSRRPKHHRHLGNYSLSKISMDDACLSRKGDDKWCAKYIAVDVVSGYWFRPAYIIGKPTLDTVTEAFRNMFCELALLNLATPGELEVEHHLMRDIDWLYDIFPFVRFCSSPTEKRAEHAIKSLKWTTAHKEGHTRGRFYAKHEAFRSVRFKKNGDFETPGEDPQTIIADDLADIEKHNNSLHPLQKTYPGMTRKDVLIKMVNPILKPIQNWHLYKYIGNQTQCTLYNNDYVKAANSEFELKDFSCLKRLQPNNTKVTAYWLPDDNGDVKEVYLYQNDKYIGEATNRRLTDYNENAIERTAEDEERILYQNKRIRKFDKAIKERKQKIMNVGIMTGEVAEIAPNINFDIVEGKQPNGIDDDGLDLSFLQDYVNPDYIREYARKQI
ncbi:MAG: hypothetical protein LBR17_01285 [Bacteroidales bacterium]|nr:hypothetical protein [Bacteroidales bacterium]